MKLSEICKNIMLISGTITSVVGAVGSIMGMMTPKVMMAKSINTYQGPEIMDFMPMIFLIGVCLIIAGILTVKKRKRHEEGPTDVQS